MGTGPQQFPISTFWMRQRGTDSVRAKGTLQSKEITASLSKMWITSYQTAEKPASNKLHPFNLAGNKQWSACCLISLTFCRICGLTAFYYLLAFLLFSENVILRACMTSLIHLAMPVCFRDFTMYMWSNLIKHNELWTLWRLWSA